MNGIKNFVDDLNMYGVDITKSFGLSPSESKIFQDQIYTILVSQEMKAPTKNIEISELIVEKLYKNNNFYSIRNDEKEEIWMYAEGIYVPNGKSYIQEFCRFILDKAYTGNITKRVFEKIIADNYIDEDQFFGSEEQDPNLHLVPVENGLLDIFNLKLLSFDPTKIFFSKIPIEYKEDIDCPKIKDFVKDIVEEDKDIPVIQELFGYLLLRDYRFERAFMFLGAGRNGKTKLAEIMKKFIGTKNCSSLQPIVFEDPTNPNVSFLHNKMANLCMDINSTQLKNTSVLKGLTGGDLITASRKYKNSITFKNYAKMIFGANELPSTRDTKDAFWERWVLLQFPYTFVDEHIFNALPEEERKNKKIKDPNIIQKITTEKEMQGLLNWSLEGLHRLLSNQTFSYKYSSDEVKAIWLRKSDSLNAFVLDKCIIEYDKKILKENFYRSYVDYCKQNKIKVQSMKMITMKLSEQGVILEKERSGKYKEYYDGIMFKGGALQYVPDDLGDY